MPSSNTERTFAPELISEPPPGSEGQRVRGWTTGPELPSFVTLRNLRKNTGSLGVPGMHSCFSGFVLTLAFSSSKRTSTPGVFEMHRRKYRSHSESLTGH